MITTVRAVLLVLFIFVSLAVNAGEIQLYRCTDLQGAVIFQMYRCEHAGDRITVRDTEHGWVKLRQGEETLLATYRRQDLARQRRSAKAAKRQKLVSKTESKACFGKRYRLKRVREKLRGGYKPEQGARLRSQSEQYAAYLHRFC